MVRSSAKQKMNPVFEEEVYKKLGINQLILFGIYSVLLKQEKCTFEKLMEKCFNLFPGAFSFDQFPQWPDARKLDRPLRALRKRKLIKGDPTTFFVLTGSGEKIAKELTRILTQKKLL